MLKKETQKLIQDYLKSHSLSQPLEIGKNNILSFHWANDKLSTGYVKNLYESEGQKEAKRREELERELYSLKETPIWLMSRHGQLKSDLYNLYLCYLDPRLRTQWFELEEILVSMNHEAGPFQSLKSMRWLDKDIYARFIYHKMITSWVPQRSFRLSLDIPLEIRAGGSPFGVLNGKIHQISTHGLVLHLASYGQAKEWHDYEEIIFLKKELSLVHESGIETCLKAQEWTSALENFTLKGKDFSDLISESINGQGGREYFVFIPFNKITLLSIKSHEQCMKNLLSIFHETQDTIHKYIEAA